MNLHHWKVKSTSKCCLDVESSHFFFFFSKGDIEKQAKYIE